MRNATSCGEAKAVESENGVVDQVLATLTINAKPADIPNEITVYISGLVIGEAIRVGDLQLPAGVTTDIDPEDPVVTAAFGAVAEPAEGEEGAEGEAGGAEEASAEAAEGGEGAESEGGDEG